MNETLRFSLTYDFANKNGVMFNSNMDDKNLLKQ